MIVYGESHRGARGLRTGRTTSRHSHLILEVAACYLSAMDAIRVSDLLHLSLEERLQLVEDLWDSIASEAESRPESLPLTQAQRQEVRRRSAAHRADPDAASPLDEALDRIESNLT